ATAAASRARRRRSSVLVSVAGIIASFGVEGQQAASLGHQGGRAGGQVPVVVGQRVGPQRGHVRRLQVGVALRARDRGEFLQGADVVRGHHADRKSTRLNSSHV